MCVRLMYFRSKEPQGSGQRQQRDHSFWVEFTRVVFCNVLVEQELILPMEKEGRLREKLNEWFRIRWLWARMSAETE